jgi:serine/threonine protein kinase
MLANRSCQTDTAVRQRYSGKVFTVLRSIAKALFELHSQRYVHGNLTVHSCAKFDDKWKLSNLLDTKRFGEILPLSVDTYAIPPEALQKTTQHGSQGQVFLKHDYVASPSIDIWAFGMVAFEALVGKPLFAGIGDTDNKTDSLIEILQWNDAVFEEAKRELRSIGVFDSGIALIGDCLSPHEAARPQIEDILQHKFWSQC